MSYQEIYEKMINSKPDVMGRVRASIVIDNGDEIIINTSNAGSHNSGGSWGRVEHWIVKKGNKTRSRFSKEQAIQVIGN